MRTSTDSRYYYIIIYAQVLGAKPQMRGLKKFDKHHFPRGSRDASPPIYTSCDSRVEKKSSDFIIMEPE